MRCPFSSVLCAALWLLTAQASLSPAGDAAPLTTVNVIVGVQPAQSIPWAPGITIWEIIKRTGTTYIGATPKSFRVTRGGERRTFDLRKIKRGEIPHPDLQPGDTLEIPD